MTVKTRCIGAASLAVALASLPPVSLCSQNGGCAATRSLVVLTGQELAPLRGAPIDQVSLYRASDAGLTPIPFQIDRKDDEGRYLIDGPATRMHSHAEPVLDGNDELVLRASDAAARRNGTAFGVGSAPLVEIALPGRSGWVYVSLSGAPKDAQNTGPMAYDAASDQVTGPAYRVRFDPQLPFLVDAFQWRRGDGVGWSPDMTDKMKIRHQGRFLGLFPFQRTQGDYVSRLTGVKAGPLRIIRRTENHIRMLWTLQSPAVYVDYLMMPRGFVMNTIIDIPFRVGLFFSDVETLTTVDWNDAPELPALTVRAPDSREGLVVNGRMSAEKSAFNRVQASEFEVASPLGRMRVDLELPPGAPITPWLYLRDARDEPDPPEEEIGQFGNVGFRTTGWEQVEPEVQRVRFIVCLEPGR
ncbi:MAG: hypothetical protein PVG38_06460 [Gammaproteobacteria bacterium]|jgi:hypothetical protein